MLVDVEGVSQRENNTHRAQLINKSGRFLWLKLSAAFDDRLLDPKAASLSFLGNQLLHGQFSQHRILTMIMRR